MNILLNKAHFPVTVLGPGRRIGLWLQGCSIRCKGCVSQDTCLKAIRDDICGLCRALPLRVSPGQNSA